MNPAEFPMFWMNHFAQPDRMVMDDSSSYYAQPSIGLSVMDEISHQANSMVSTNRVTRRKCIAGAGEGRLPAPATARPRSLIIRFLHLIHITSKSKSLNKIALFSKFYRNITRNHSKLYIFVLCKYVHSFMSNVLPHSVNRGAIFSVCTHRKVI